MHHVKVGKCDVTTCCYNTDQRCHAVAIQVGDNEPLCDTFSPAGSQCGIRDYEAEVGACKVSECSFNKSLVCDAPAINVGWVNNSAECRTFKRR
ncbi:MAG: hypothetical protein A2X94_04130 [Bdellovibrionales bacterium GWB1_55_8]|nr:MAG: hypothetical protein A2X94_04130 [Bdellovibrionales bacterium GWB1_55_8]